MAGDLGEDLYRDCARLIWLRENHAGSAGEKQAGNFIDSFITESAEYQDKFSAGEIFLQVSGKLPGGGKLPSGGTVPGRTGGSGEPGSGELPGRSGGEAAPSSGEFPGGTDRSAGGRAGFPSGGTAGGPGGATTSAALSKLLETGASGYKWAAATVSSTSAASLELNSNGVPVMAIGGFTGSDPAPSLAEFKKLVAEHEIHYFIGGGVGGGGGIGGAGSSDASQITSWVESHFTSKTVGGTTVYNLTSPKTSS